MSDTDSEQELLSKFGNFLKRNISMLEQHIKEREILHDEGREVAEEMMNRGGQKFVYVGNALKVLVTVGGKVIEKMNSSKKEYEKTLELFEKLMEN